MVTFYSQYIPNFSQIARPLHKLTSKNEKFIWTEESENAFKILKEKLINPPILGYPNFDLPFEIHTDASNTAVGMVLSQNQNGKTVVIAYSGRSLTPAELNYSTTEKELVAIIAALKKFQPFIYGSKIKLWSDHQPLRHLRKLKNPQGRISRWIFFLEKFLRGLK